MDDDFRGTGRTTKQMREAPQGATFVWPVRNSVPYAKDLARELGRGDLQIVTPEWLEGRQWHGRELSGIVVDHATHLSPRQCDYLNAAIGNVR